MMLCVLDQAELVLVRAGAGLRQGEAFGLALDRIDAAGKLITVGQQVVIVGRRTTSRPSCAASGTAPAAARWIEERWPGESAHGTNSNGQDLTRHPVSTNMRSSAAPAPSSHDRA
jgi:hypothetical protein